MHAWSFAGLRPKLDRFFDNVRTSLDARAASGVDRRRLEDFRLQADSVQERLYACLESDDRSDLPAILKQLQVLAYRTRVFFGTPLPGVAWDDVTTMIEAVPPPRPTPRPASRPLEAAAPASYASGDLRDSRRDAKLPERTLVSATPAMRDRSDSVPAEVAPPEPSELAPSELAPSEPTTSSAAPLEPAPSLSAPSVSAAAALPTPTLDPPLPDPSPESVLVFEEPLLASEAAEPSISEAAPPEASPEPALAAPPAGWDLPRWPFLLGCLAFLVAAIAGATLGGTYPPLTALACGVLGVAVTRP